MVVVEYSGDGARGHEIVVFEKIENFEIFVKFFGSQTVTLKQTNDTQTA